MLPPLAKVERGLRKTGLAEFLQQLIRVPPQQIKGFRSLGTEQDANRLAMLLDMEFDMAKLLGLQQHVNTAGFRGRVMGQKLRRNRYGQ